MTDELIRKSDALAIAQNMNNGETAKAIARAIAALPVVVPSVKPLEWHQTSTEPARWLGHQADVSNPDYVIHLNADSPDVFAWGLDGDGWHGFCDTLEAAKAAAQQDYEARILASLTPTPVDASQAADPAIKVLDDDLYDLLAAPDTDDPDALRFRRHGQILFAQAKGSGWVDDGGEGPLEFLMRRTREVALEDAVPDPACDHCGMDPAAIREAALMEAHDAIADYPRVAPDGTEAQHYDEQIEYCQSIILALAKRASDAK